MTDNVSRKPDTAVGGGVKKVLYTVATMRRMGVGKAAKALKANNTCKACGLGMGGQRGGMTNELGEFPAVCNKSVQAQSTDVQPAIPVQAFGHSVAELAELTERELANLGRLDQPLHKAPGADRYTPLLWDDALALAAARLAAAAPDRTFFYSSGRASNEAGFVLQLLARLYGTNHVNNCSYYCHQATSVALDSSVGTGTATVELADLTGCDLVFLIGANPASNHPRLIHQLQACRERGGQVVVINPAREPGLVRFAVPKSAKSMLTGGTWIATEYLQPRIGSDIALLKALGKAVLAAGGADDAFIADHTEGFAEFAADLESQDWAELSRLTGVERAAVERVAARYCEAERVVFAWGMGLTHHLHGVENVEYVANLALLRGMVGKRFAGLLPLRGHSNVQGIGTIGVKPVLPEQVFQRIEHAFGVNLPRTPGYDTMAAMQAAHRGAIDAAVVMGGNLYGATPDSRWAAEALDRVPFKLFMTTTLNGGHVNGVASGESLVLPVTARDEEWEPTTQESMFNYVRLSDGGIHRLAGVRPETWILCELAERLLPGCPVDFEAFRAHAKVRQAIAATVPGMEDLADLDVARREFHVRGRILHAPEFKTPSGRARFLVRPTPAPSATADFPYTLTTARSEGQFNTIVYEDEDVYRGTRHRWCVLMSPADIAALGIEAGARVTVRSARGVMAGVRVEPFELPPGNLMAYFPEANVLTGTAVDPRSKTPSFKATPVRVEPTLAGAGAAP